MFKVNEKKEIERKNDLITRAEEIVNGAEAEQRELTDDEKQELAEIRDDVRDIKEKLETIAELNNASTEPAKDINENACDVEEAEKRAFENYIRGVLETRNTDVVLDKASNGAVIPETIVKKIISKLYNICPILERSSKYNIKGKAIIPYYDETSHAITVDYADEFEELTSSVGSFTNIELTGFLAGALTLVSRSLLNNSDFNLTDFVVEKMAYAIKRWIEGELLHGTSQKIEGLSGVTTAVTAASQTAITADELIDLHDSILDDFQNDAIWIMSKKTRTAVRKLKTTTGEYLFNNDPSAPFGGTILGKPVYITDNMPEMAAGKTAIYYGDMSGLATKFSEDMTIEVLREKYATQHAVGIVGWIEADGKVEQQQKLAKLVMAAE